MLSDPRYLLLAALLAVNLAAFAAFGWDKRRAVRGGRRVSEAALCWLAFFGGAAGAWLATRAFRHKTVKTSFRLKLLLATLGCLAWLAALAWWQLGG